MPLLSSFLTDCTASPKALVKPHHDVQADEVYKKPCIYMQMDPDNSEEANVDEETGEAGDGLSPELRLVPSDSSKCERFTLVQNGMYLM